MPLSDHSPDRRRGPRSPAGLLIAGSLPASAHVHVEADDATAGGFTVLTFRVPNESDTAGTVQGRGHPAERPSVPVRQHQAA